MKAPKTEKLIIIDECPSDQYRLMEKLGWNIKELPLEDTVTLP